MAQDTFVVEEINPKHGFARVRPEEGTGLLHTALYPDPEFTQAPPFQLRKGDRVTGLRRGETVSEVSWLTRVEPPWEEVERVAELLALLERWEIRIPHEARVLAEHAWRDSKDNPLRDELQAQLPTFFDLEGAHPFEDPTLLERLSAAMQPYLPGFVIQPVQGQPAVRVEPGAVEVQAGVGSWDVPQPTFVPMIAEVNARLAAAGAPVRWVPTREDWMLAPPALAALLQKHGLLEATAPPA
ncbi:hypothetical protein HRD49_21250 [Corallococcus exiguus]|uniref:Uncharacterized protein n=1 Tax=Corallococcus exiguus TaxID=83462 RepID=A0A7X4Y893_9BACT|nr:MULTISPECIES: hypothetical protein [Corallococcus]RKI39525.1 hypothetical protein D7Y27_21880 [Corallococcus sp. AB004]NBC39919.1 hypothetical protein [Corallococcus exiguus]NNC20250.1 hypothetical protein [Corallococcus exiguus]NPD23497.1 hypothetical protein [Corallococcus exiguus]NRD57622.1 hypothetical protein [Corallococcus exiguus]